jgi:hypothetical protein
MHRHPHAVKFDVSALSCGIDMKFKPVKPIRTIMQTGSMTAAWPALRGHSGNRVRSDF